MTSEKNAGDRWHLGSMNDGLFIINRPPSPAGTDVEPHVREDGPTLILNITDLPDNKAQAVVDAHNAELTAKDGEIDRLRAALEPFAKTAKVYRDVVDGFHVTGETSAERRFSEGEQIETARDAAYEYLTGLGIDHYLTAEDAVLAANAAKEGTQEPDWWWRDLDPDDSGDSPHEALRNVPDFTVCHLLSSYIGPDQFAFRAPTLDPENDDDEVLLFDTEQEALEAAKARGGDNA